jgi:hypothetical protein
VADDGERFADVLHLPQELLHLRHHPHGVGVQGAAGEEDRNCEPVEEGRKDTRSARNLPHARC